MNLKFPLIILNFKTYKQSTGENALKLSKICESVNKKYTGTVLISPPQANLSEISEKVNVGIIAQSIDPFEPGRHTGSVTAQSIKNYAIGTFINHSERKLKLKDIKNCIDLCKRYGLMSLCFSQDLRKIKKILKFGPDFIAYEPEELIAKASVSKTKPEMISKVVRVVNEKNKKRDKKVRVLCGAGISNRKDVEKAIELGTVGVVLSSAFVKSKNPEMVLKGLTGL